MYGLPSLKKELLGALSNSGPVGAISACRLEAPKIAKDVLPDGGSDAMSIGRTALRVRRPENAPTTQQVRVLKDLQKQLERKQQGPVEWHEVEGGVLHYMRAIPTGEVCVTCHGKKSQLDAKVLRG